MRALSSARSRNRVRKGENDSMKKRALGRTGLMVSEIGVGAWQLGGPLLLDGKVDGHPDVGKEKAIALIRACGQRGINFIDTAEQYGAGESERRVGEAIAGQRDRWVVATKFGAMVGPGGERVSDVTAARVPVSLEGSLRRLRTDYVDVYLYHVPPDPKEAEGVARYLDQAKREGKVRAVGISTDRIEACRLLLDVGGLDVVELPQNILEPRKELAAFLAEHQLGGIVRGAFAHGRLSGKYFHAPPRFAPEDIRGNWYPADRAAAEFGRYAVFEELVTPSRSMVQLALRYLLDRPTTGTIILGAKTLAEYETAIAASELPGLAETENARLGALRDRLLI
jgi:aryl-alcohol dehydrogenase-like predicted oxidoreductase